MPGGHPPWMQADGRPRYGMPRGVRLWLPVVVSFIFQFFPAMFVAWRSHYWGGAAATPQDMAIGVSLALVGPIALIWARRFPGPIIAVIAAAAAADVLFNPNSGPPYVALAFAIVLGIIRGARAWVFISVGSAWVLTLVIVSFFGPQVKPFRIAAITLGVVICIGIGEAIRARRERMRSAREASARRRVDAVQEERVRIARELHDVLAHSLSQINVQAGVGLHLIRKQPQKAEESLANIVQTSKTALDEVRGVLGILRDENAGADAPLLPQPDLAQLPALIDRAGQGGLDVSYDNALESAPPGPVQFAIYRIVQEALTNVVRHAEARVVRVILREESGDYVLEVTDDGRGMPSGVDDGSQGRGILGMRERTASLGGTLVAGARPGPSPSPGTEGSGAETAESEGGGFSVVARIPIGRAP